MAVMFIGLQMKIESLDVVLSLWKRNWSLRNLWLNALSSSESWSVKASLTKMLVYKWVMEMFKNHKLKA